MSEQEFNQFLQFIRARRKIRSNREIYESDERNIHLWLSHHNELKTHTYREIGAVYSMAGGRAFTVIKRLDHLYRQFLEEQANKRTHNIYPVNIGI